MKKVFAAFLLVLAMAFSVPVQAQSDFDLNRDFNNQFTFKSTIYGGRVVGIRTYLSIREEPSVYSREIMRIPNGADLTLRFTGDQNWWQVISVRFNGREYSNPAPAIGWVSAKYVQIN